MHGIATARQHERTREAELRMIHAVTGLPEGWPASEMDTTPRLQGTQMFFNEQPGAELKAVYGAYLELVTN